MQCKNLVDSPVEQSRLQWYARKLVTSSFKSNDLAYTYNFRKGRINKLELSNSFKKIKSQVFNFVRLHRSPSIASFYCYWQTYFHWDGRFHAVSNNTSCFFHTLGRNLCK